MLDYLDFMEAMTVDIPEGDNGRIMIKRFGVEENYLGKWRDVVQGREIPAGTYTGLAEKTGKDWDNAFGIRGWDLWMSDTPAEKRAHMDALRMAQFNDAERVLVNGLGIGMVVKGLLAIPTVKHIDVVEINPDVIKMVAPAYDDPRVHITEADAFAKGIFPKGTRWDIAWHDIWPDAGDAYKDEVARLLRSYGHRVEWQGVWEKERMQGRGRWEKERMQGRGRY